MNTIHNKSELDLSLFHRIDINLYPLFVAIYEHSSITQAATMLCVSQSAVSHALQRLRLLLKDDLFVRHQQKMRPTPFAEQIYPAQKFPPLPRKITARIERSFSMALNTC